MNHFGFVAAVVGLSLGLSGCSSQSASEQAAPAGSPSAAHNHGEHTDHAHGEHSDHGDRGQTEQSNMDKMMTELAKLSPAEWNKLFADITPQQLAKNGRPFPLSDYFTDIVEGYERVVLK